MVEGGGLLETEHDFALMNEALSLSGTGTEIKLVVLDPTLTDTGRMRRGVGICCLRVSAT